MSDYSKLNIIYRLQKWMDSVPGQTFLNYAYSWGASIVILGTLFKLTHLPGANVMLFIGMGTEVMVFFFSAFDRPFDKTANGRDIPTHVDEEYLETGEFAGESKPTNTNKNVKPVMSSSGNVTPVYATQPQENNGVQSTTVSQKENPVQTTIPGNQSSHNVGSDTVESDTVESGTVETPVSAVQQQTYVPQMSAEDAAALNEVQGNYIEELKKLIDTLGKVNEQSTRLTRDSEEMENLNRTLTGISKVYEMQLKGASQQIGTIDQINDQTRKMAAQIEQLNKIYARMIQAMTVNMRASVPNAAPNNVEE